jgi:hypothetical protein
VRSRKPLPSLLAVALSGAGLGCSASTPPPPPRPAGLPPTPTTVTVENPGGDAFDPELAALDRLANEPWSTRRDRENTLLIPLADARHWQRVRLWGYPTRAAFRYGDDHYGIIAAWYRPTSGKGDPESCLTEFIAEARPIAEGYGARVMGTRVVHTTQRTPVWRRPRIPHLRAPQQDAHEAPTYLAGPVVVQVVDAEVDGLLENHTYAGALASYPSWPGTCLLQGFVVIADKHKDVAERVRDRWVAEGAPRFAWHPQLSQAPSFESR